ncbi:MAG TPA: recombinase family protein [Candidatus Limnocylindrales bacterium]
MSEPYAYIRRSVASRGDPGDQSREFQTDKVRQLAGPDADRLHILDGDWGRSASTDKTGLRTAFLSLIEDVEAGAVSHVFAYSPDRLARSVEWSARLVNACRRAGVPITTTAGTVGPADPGARMLFNVFAAMNENALEAMEQKARDTIGNRRKRNLAAGLAANAGMGRKPYGAMPGEDVGAILDAFRRTGSFLGTCKALTAAGIPSRLGNGWNVRTVARIIRRTEPSLVPAHGRQGQRARATRIFAGLLVCHCGDVLTSMPRAGSVGYYCRRAHSDPRHSRPYVVAEPKIRAWAEREATRFRPVDADGQPIDRVRLAETSREERKAIDARRDRIMTMFERGDLDPSEYAARMDAIAADRTALDDQERVATLPPGIDWTWSPASLNVALRALWHRIELGPDLRPVRAEWTVPEWRA